MRTGFAVLEGFELNRLRHESIYSLSSPKLMRLMLSQKELSTIRVYSVGNQILGARLIGAFSGPSANFFGRLVEILSVDDNEATDLVESDCLQHVQ